MNAEIIAVGTELLLGDIVNTNAQFIAKELAALGIGVYFQTVVGDNEARLSLAYEIAFGRADLVITTGGLGPTKDDLTKETAAKYINRPLVLHGDILRGIEAHFKRQNLQITESNQKQAYLPEGAVPLPNPNGTAPGCLIEHAGKMLIMLPGPGREMRPMLKAHVVPFLQGKTGQIFASRTLRLCGIGESRAEEILAPIIQAQSNPTIAPYAKSCEVHLRLTAAAESEAAAQGLIAPIAEDIYAALGACIYGEDDTTLEAAVVGMLRNRGHRVACAESCTGGMLSARLINTPGASAVLEESVITYSNAAKEKRLGVAKDTLAQHGAVSPQTAVQMAKGAARMACADMGVGITGIAGPDGGSEEKPVGLVYIAVCYNGETTTEELRIAGDRERIRTRTVVTALDMMRRRLKRVGEEQP